MDERGMRTSDREKYKTICEILLIAKYINMIHPEPIYFTSPSDKYKGWEGTMKPSY